MSSLPERLRGRFARTLPGMDLLRTVIIALVLAVIVAIVFSAVAALSGYAAVAGILTFLLVLLAGFTGNLSGRV